MTSAINVQYEVAKLREEVMHSFRTYLPSKEFSTRMILALIWMHMLVKRIETSRDLSERRKLFNDFVRSKNLIEHWTRALPDSHFIRS
jgi:hypothetical protein